MSVLSGNFHQNIRVLALGERPQTRQESASTFPTFSKCGIHSPTLAQVTLVNTSFLGVALVEKSYYLVQKAHRT